MKRKFNKNMGIYKVSTILLEEYDIVHLYDLNLKMIILPKLA